MERLKETVCMIYDGLPTLEGGGGSSKAAYGIVKGLIDLNKKVYCIGTKRTNYKNQVYYNLKKLGVNFYNKKLIKTYNYGMFINAIIQYFTNYYSSSKLTEKGKKFLKKSKLFLNKFNLVIIFGNDNIKFFRNSNKNIIAILEDHLPSSKIERNLLSNKSLIQKYLRHFFLKIYYLRFDISINKMCSIFTKTYTFSKKEYLNYKNKNFKNINYLRSPIIFEKEIKKIKNKKIKIAMVNYHYSQDLIGLRNLYNYIIPELKKKNFNNFFEFYLIMNFDEAKPDFLNKLIEEKNVFKKNYSSNCLNDIDLLLYPSNYGVGVRSKILEAFTKKCLVCTLNQSKNGIPELRNNYNCLISNNIQGLLNEIIKLVTINRFKINNINRFKINNIIKNAYRLVKTNYNHISVVKCLLN
jgi:hypothetical protein